MELDIEQLVQPALLIALGIACLPELARYFERKTLAQPLAS